MRGKQAKRGLHMCAEKKCYHLDVTQTVPQDSLGYM